MPIDLDLNAVVANVAAIVKDTWSLTTVIHEAGMQAQITAAKFPFAGIDFEPCPIRRGVGDITWELPIRVTYCLRTTAASKDMDTARGAISDLAKAILADRQLAAGGAASCSRVDDLTINFSGSERFLALALANEWPVVGASVECPAIGIEHDD